MARLVLGLLSQVRINQSQHHIQKKIKSNFYYLAHDATLTSNIRFIVEIPESGPPFPLQHLPRHLRDHHGLQQLFPGIPIIFLADHQLMLSLLILKFFYHWWHSTTISGWLHDFFQDVCWAFSWLIMIFVDAEYEHSHNFESTQPATAAIFGHNCADLASLNELTNATIASGSLSKFWLSRSIIRWRRQR